MYRYRTSGFSWCGSRGSPYKLARERNERSQQIARLATRLGRLEAELKTMPTVTELVEWQETLDRRSAQVSARVERLGHLAESLSQQREETRALPEQHAAVCSSLDDRLCVIEQQGTDAGVTMPKNGTG